MFEEVRAHTPSMAAWMECCYGSQPLLHLGDHTILSCCGVQQGDPLGPLGFALALHPIVERIKEEVPGLLINVWYLDDGTLCGSADDILKAIAIIEEDGPSRGLILNKGKSLLFVPTEDIFSHNPFPAEIPIARDGFDLLGCPIGSPTYCASSVHRRVQKVEEILHLLPDLEDSQMEATLLQACLALPKISFALRTCPPNYIKEAIAKFDLAMFKALSDLVGGSLSDWSWKKASLPISLGGLGVRQASLYASAAYIGSLDQSKQLVSNILGHHPPTPVSLSPTLEDLALASGREDWTSLEEVDVPLRQRALSRVVDQACFDFALSNAPNDRARALALSSTIPHAGDWLRVVPSTALGLHLHDWEFRLCLQYWLGVRMMEEGSKCPVCQATTDGFGDHQVSCGGNGDRIHRHDSLRDALFSVAQSAALAPRREVPALMPGTKSRPADLYLPCWKRGRPAALDVTVISPLQKLTIKGAATTQGHALGVGEERKRASHSSTCYSAGISFVPLVVETLGGWSLEAVETIQAIGHLQSQRLGLQSSQTITHLFQQLAIRLWKGNACMWTMRVPVTLPTVDGIM